MSSSLFAEPPSASLFDHRKVQFSIEKIYDGREQAHGPGWAERSSPPPPAPPRSCLSSHFRNSLCGISCQSLHLGFPSRFASLEIPLIFASFSSLISGEPFPRAAEARGVSGGGSFVSELGFLFPGRVAPLARLLDSPRPRAPRLPPQRDPEDSVRVIPPPLFPSDLLLPKASAADRFLFSLLSPPLISLVFS